MCAPGLQAAVAECRDKHKNAKSALYGRLGYILLTVVAADQFGVYGMTLEGNQIEQLVPKISVSCAHLTACMPW